jgi:bifunctional non-homologous end joining protein LigD
LIRPMLAASGTLPTDAGWSFEFKWDGVRAVVYVTAGTVRILSRNDRDVSVTYPELAAVGGALGKHEAVLDGEIVALAPDGRPSFGALQHRMGVMQGHRAAQLASEQPVVLMLFDVLYLDGVSTLEDAYTERRKRLEALALSGPHWQTPPSFPSNGETVLAAAEEQRLEGVMAKRSKSTYVPGRRSESWRKVKVERTQIVVVGGYTPGRGRRSEGIGALLLGLPGEGGLTYVGKVGTGFTDSALSDLERRLRPLRRATSPFSEPLPASQTAGAVWCRPELIGEVRYGEWTGDRRLRHPVWRGLRPDAEIADVALEP